MTSASEITKTVQKFTVDNSPLILTAVGALGVAATAVLAGKGGFKASQIIEEHEAALRIKREAGQPTPHLTAQEKFLLTWKQYVPACGIGLITIGAVVTSNQIGTRRAAALAAAFTLSEKAASQYKDKVTEILGDKKANVVKDKVAQDRVNENPPTSDNIIIVGGGQQVFQDSWSGRYFKSETEDVRQAVNELNHQLNLHGHATLTEFYELLGLEKTRQSDEIGWNADNLLDVYFAAVMHENQTMPVLAIEYRVVPTRDYFRTR